MSSSEAGSISIRELVGSSGLEVGCGPAPGLSANLVRGPSGVLGVVDLGEARLEDVFLCVGPNVEGCCGEDRADKAS